MRHERPCKADRRSRGDAVLDPSQQRLDGAGAAVGVGQRQRRLAIERAVLPAQPDMRLVLAAEYIFGGGHDPDDAQQTIGLILFKRLRVLLAPFESAVVKEDRKSTRLNSSH